ncbi:MAG: protein kinase [Gemmatimonadota bacterium]
MTESQDLITRLTGALADRYRIERELGAGGMATVYLAEDLKHERMVALKVLKPELAAVVGAERFLAEIKTTASLQHPNILPLHDSGSADSFLFYVMPYVEGESLRNRLDREKQLPIDEAVRIATDVAEALQAAHEQGVIHRDIKPANVLLNRGRPLLADFGIALAVSAAGGGRMTETGLSMGTPFYMSPEQASADRDATAASDIYSLGCVLYEMLVGDPPHTGGTAQAVLAKILTDDPPAATAARTSIPAHVDAVLRKSLERLPADRFVDARQFAEALSNPAFRHGSVAGGAAGSHWTRRRVAAVAAGAVSSLALGLLIGRGMAPPSETATGEIVVSEILPPDGEDFADRRSFGALSPDGRSFAFVSLSSEGERRLRLRRLDALETELLPGTSGAENPFWSPDGQSLAYFADGQLMRLDLGTSSPRSVCAVDGATSGAWGEGDLIVFATPRGLERVGPDGCEVVLPLDSASLSFRSPSLVGDGRSVVLQRRWSADSENGAYGASVVHADLETGDMTTVIEAALRPTFVPPNRIVYARRVPSGFALFGQRTIPDGSEVVGEPVVLTGAVRDTDLELSASASASGSLIYLPTLGNREKLLVDRGGEIVDTLRQRRTWTFRAAREHPWAMMAESWALWLYDYERGVSTPLIQGEGETFVADPVWAPGDTALAFGMCLLGSLEGLSEPATVPIPDCVRATDWSPDGRHLVVEAGVAANQVYNATRSVVAYDLEENSALPLFDVSGVNSEARVSPDGGWIAFTSWDTGTPEVYLRPFLTEGRAQRLTTGGARSPRWGADAGTLYYQTADGRIMVLEAMGAAELATTAPRQLFRAEGYSRAMFFDRGTSFDLTADGQRFILRLRETVGRAVLVQNWPAKLEAVERSEGG